MQLFQQAKMQHISTPWHAAKEQAHQCQLHPHGLIKNKLGYPCNKNQQQTYILYILCTGHAK